MHLCVVGMCPLNVIHLSVPLLMWHVACVYAQIIVVTVISYLASFDTVFGVKIVGHIPTGYV